MLIKRIIVPSATVSINTIAQLKKNAGETIFNFAGGDPALVNHPCILAGAAKGMQHGLVPYAPLSGLPPLRKLAAEWVNRQYGCEYSPQNVLVTCGGKFALFAALHALIGPHDEVLISAPYWPSYPELVRLCEGVPRIIETQAENEWKVTPEELKKHLGSKVRVLIMNNANNPTGTLYTQEEIREILQIAKEGNWIVISDEVYSEIVYDQNTFVSCGAFPEHRERVVITQSCSKNFGMTGWRVGFVFAPEPLIQAMTSLQGQTTTGTSSMSQMAAISALENAPEVTAYVKKAMEERRECWMNGLNKHFGFHCPAPASTIYSFIPLDLFGNSSASSLAVCEQILKESNVAAVPGIAFGQEGYLRFAFSETPETLEKGLASLARGF
jgi:aspartate aminotransferase